MREGHQDTIKEQDAALAHSDNQIQAPDFTNEEEECQLKKRSMLLRRPMIS